MANYNRISLPVRVINEYPSCMIIGRLSYHTMVRSKNDGIKLHTQQHHGLSMATRKHICIGIINLHHGGQSMVANDMTIVICTHYHDAMDNGYH